MQIIDLFEPSLLTLFIFMLLPFLYFGYHQKYWYDLKKQKTGDFFLFSIIVVLLAIVVIKAGELWKNEAEKDYVYFTLLHLGPLLQALMIIYFKNPLKEIIDAKTQNNNSAGQGGQTAQNFRPENKSIEHITWNDLVINDSIRTELLSVIELLKNPKTSEKYGIKVPKGIILSGPPGNGKTTVAKVIANTAGLNFFSLAADEIISKWVGESEKNLTQLFNAARKHKPSVVFIDEIDTIGRARSEGGQQWSENLLNHFLQIIDGVYKSEGVYVIGATNRPDLIDPALKRSGRLNKEIELPLPDNEARAKLFHLYLHKLNLAGDVNITSLAEVTEGLAAADISGICNQAGINSFKRESATGKQEYLVTHEDLLLALNNYLSK